MSVLVPDDLVLTDTCRACMSRSQDDTDIFESIFKQRNRAEGGGPDSIMELLNAIVPELPKAEPDDDLPKLICTSCLQLLEAFNEFKVMCLRTDTQLRNSLSSFIDEDVNEFVQETPEISEVAVKDPLQSLDSNNAVDKEITTFLKLEISEEPSLSSKNSDKIDSRQTSIKDDSSENHGDSKDNFNSSTDADTSSESEISIDSCNDESAECEPPSKKVRKSYKARSSKSNTDETKQTKSSAQPAFKKKAPEKVTCPICQNVLAHAKSLRKHTKRMHPEHYIPIAKPSLDGIEEGEYHKCDECERCFAKKRYLRKHKYVHKRQAMKKDHTCNICNETFESLVELSGHKTDKHFKEASEKPYICNVCNKGFKIPGSLKEHLRIHSDEVSFLCPECGKAFNSNSNLQQHLLRHTGERRYQCPECPKKFACSSDLSTHKEVHTKSKPHVCDICGSAFGRNYTLKKHKMRHSGEKPHPCEYCGQRFVTADHMRRHMRTHTGEKPYKCKYCERAFAQSNDLIKHLRSHLGENVYRCELCPKAFRLLSSLREHWTEHKNDDEETKERNRQALLTAEEDLRLQFKTTPNPIKASNKKIPIVKQEQAVQPQTVIFQA